MQDAQEHFKGAGGCGVSPYPWALLAGHLGCQYHTGRKSHPLLYGCLLGVPAVLMAELDLVEGLLQADLDKSWSSWLLTLLSCDPRNCCKPTAVKVSGNGRVNRY